MKDNKFSPIEKNESLKIPEWKDFDREGKEKKRNIRKQGEKDGSLGIPSGETLSDTENEIYADAYEYQHKLADSGREYFQKLEARINSCSDFLNRENFKAIFNHLNTNVQNRIDRVKLKLSELERAHKKNTEDYERFRRINRLNRTPVPATPQKLVLQLALVVLFFAVEVSINTILVADHLPGGGREALFLTLAVAFLNVFISFAVGYYSLKYLNHIDSHLKNITRLIFALYIIAIFYLNWAYGAFRTIAVRIAQMEEPDMNKFLEATQEAMRPWTEFLNFQSLIVSIVGFAFAIFSLLDGYLLDDAYPDYGRKTRLRNKSRKNIEVELRKLVSGVQEIFREKQRESKKMKETLMHTVNLWSEETNLLQTKFESYQKKISNAENDINHMLKEYVIANQNIREKTKHPLPKRFENKNPFSYSYDQKNSFKVFEASKDVYMEDHARREKREKLQKDIEENYSTFTKQVSGLREKTLVSIKEIQKQYETA